MRSARLRAVATIYDVAREAQVSLATVSAVINASAYVSPGLKNRVTSAIRKLEYQPNLLARSLATQQTRTLGMIAPNIANPFWPEVVRGVEDGAHAAGYTLLLASSDDDRAKESLYLRMFLAKRVDGLLLCKTAGGLDADIAARIRTTRTPLVQMMRSSRACAGDRVLVDEEGGSYEAVAHLLRLGYRRIAAEGIPVGAQGRGDSLRSVVDRGGRIPRRSGLRRGNPSVEEEAGCRLHRELSDDRRLHARAAPVPASLSG